MSDNQSYAVITTKVCCDMEPLAQLISVLLDTLNDIQFDDLNAAAKHGCLEYVAKVCSGGK